MSLVCTVREIYRNVCCTANLRFLRVGSGAESWEHEGVAVLPEPLLKRLILLSTVATGVLALLSVSFSLTPSLRLPCVLVVVLPFLFFCVDCWFEWALWTSRCLCTLASLYLRTLLSGTHSSQLFSKQRSIQSLVFIVLTKICHTVTTCDSTFFSNNKIARK